MFTVKAISDYYNRLSGLIIRAGEVFTARHSLKLRDHYHVYLGGQWFCVPAECFSVISANP